MGYPWMMSDGEQRLMELIERGEKITTLPTGCGTLIFEGWVKVGQDGSLQLTKRGKEALQAHQHDKDAWDELVREAREQAYQDAHEG